MSHVHVHDYGRTGNKILRRLTFHAWLKEISEPLSQTTEPIQALGINGLSLTASLLKHPRCALRRRRLPSLASAQVWLERRSSRPGHEFLLFTAMELDYLLFRDSYEWGRDYFRILTQFDDPRVPEIGDGVLCHVRCDDAWPTEGRTPHPHYPVAPVRFYEEVAERTGKPLYIMGQWHLDQEYAERLSRIPGTQFIAMQSELEDLRLLLHANEIALSCSTFSWAAAFLRLDYATVHMPRIGIFDDSICPSNEAELPGCYLYDYEMGIWYGDSRDRNYMLQ